MPQRHLGLLQPLGLSFVFQRPYHLRKPYRRGCHAGGIAGEIHAAGHVIQRLLLYLFLDLAGMPKTQHRHTTDHQRHRHHQQIKDQQTTAGAGEKRRA